MCLSEMYMLEQSHRDCEKETPFSKENQLDFFFFMAVLASQQN